tara:strand:- start:521 stop:1297 length:777 start_codon:yes stop_codon:yes gene_type:complete
MHISFSELKMWAECPWKHRLVYIDKIKKFVGNEFTAFGSALHALCEHAIVEKIQDDEYDEFFEHSFEKEIARLLVKGAEFDQKLVDDMLIQARLLSPQIIPEVVKHFEGYEVYSVEEMLYENINDFDTDYKFKGYIDLVLKTPDNKYHIIDWKTCSWGWDAKKKSDKLLTYQLTLYKKFFCQKHNIDPLLVETHFALLKRTAKKNNVEIFRVTSGRRKIANATELLIKGIRSIKSGLKIKNRNSCTYCEFRHTNDCPR